MHLIGVDIGGTRLKAARVDVDGRVVARAGRPTGAAGGPPAVLAAVAALVETLCEDGPPAALGLAFAGPVDPVAGLVRHAPNLPGWEGLRLSTVIGERLAIDVVALVNDATAFTHAEAREGAGRGAASVVGLTLGTGVGGGIVVDGRPWHGATGGAGELGHVCLDPAGAPCGCGGRGCLETRASATAVVRAGRERLGPGAPADAPGLASLARTGDARAKAIWDDAGAALGQTLGLIANVLCPARVVIGGGLAGAWDLLEPAARAALVRHAFAHNAASLEVVRGTLGDDAGPLGAALAARAALAEPAV